MDMMATLSLPPVPALCATLAALATPACERSSPPDVPEVLGPLSVVEPRRDFGRVFEGQLLAHEWRLEVRQPLAVGAAKTDCGCTLARLERGAGAARSPYTYGEPLAAGEELLVSVRYDTRGRRGPTERAVTLSLADGGVFPLHVAAEIQPWLLFEPDALEFLRVLEGQGAECAFQVRSAAGAAFRLEATRSALPPWVTLELQPESPGDGGRARLWSGRGRIGAEAPRGTYSYPLELVSDVVIPAHASQAASLGDAVEPRTFSIAPTWTLQVVGPVALSSPTLEFGLVRAEETVAQTVRLESFDPAFTPGNASAHLESLKPDEAFPLARTARVRTRLAGRVCEIELTLAGLDAEVAGTFLGKLVVETGHPGLPRLEALVRGVRAPDRETR